MRTTLFWRTFLLIAGLVVACLLIMLELVRAFDPAPAEQTLAWEIASVVNLTRSGLVSAQPERRRQLLTTLAREEGVRVLPLEVSDRVDAMAGRRSESLLARLHQLLGPATRLAAGVNGDPGLWVSFDIDGDPYWLGLEGSRFDRHLGPPWVTMLVVAAGLALVGALMLASPLSKPLANLARALDQVSRGRAPAPLVESGTPEIAALNRRFNRMAAELAQLESDRAVALAGISHDIRTPLTRLRMEIELSALGPEDKRAMNGDIERIDRIVGKFTEYARVAGEHGPARRIGEVMVADVLSGALAGYQPRREAGLLTVHTELPADLVWRGDPIDLERMLANLLENAVRHGSTPGSGRAELSIGARRLPAGLEMTLSDRGPGVPAAERERLLRPFSRIEDERSEAGGSGLGLAIVARLTARYGGTCELEAGPQGEGLTVRLTLPDAARR
jgi:two-component system osmolarity sensor histidine kinase EnvZ